MTLTNWLIVAIIFIIIEILTPGLFFFFCLATGAIFAGVTVLLTKSIFIQILVFCITSLISIYLVRPLIKKLIKHQERYSNVDALINRTCSVIEKISPNEMGTVKIDGQLWKAEAENMIEPGEKVRIISIKGTHLVVEKILSDVQKQGN